MSKKRTLNARLCEACEKRGWKRVMNARTSKYDVFERPAGPVVNPFIYVGCNGALRTGRTMTSSCSNDPLRTRLLAEVPE